MSRNYANVVAVYRGDTELDAVRKGDTLIWQRESEDHYLLEKPSEATFNITSLLDISICIAQSKNLGTLIDWGDNSERTLVSGLKPILKHSYPEAGVYTAKIYSYSDNIWMPGADQQFESFMNFSAEKETDTILTKFICGDHCSLLGQYSFYECAGLTYVDVGENDIIGPYTFMGCKSLATVIFPPNTDIVIKSYAFNDCDALTWNLFTFLSIEDHAFMSCSGLPANIEIRTKNLEQYAFSGCSTLRKVWLRSSIEKITVGKNSQATFGPFANCNAALVLYAEPESRPVGDADHTWEEGFNGGSATVSFDVVWGQTASPF